MNPLTTPLIYSPDVLDASAGDVELRLIQNPIPQTGQLQLPTPGRSVNILILNEFYQIIKSLGLAVGISGGFFLMVAGGEIWLNCNIPDRNCEEDSILTGEITFIVGSALLTISAIPLIVRLVRNRFH